MIAPGSAYRPDGPTAALGIYLVVYCAVGACLAFGLFSLLPPLRVSNFGLAAYAPPPGAVVTYARPSQATRVAEPITPVERPTARAALIGQEPATTGRSTPEPELQPTIIAPPSQPRTAKRPSREAKTDSSKQRVARCIAGYASH